MSSNNPLQPPLTAEETRAILGMGKPATTPPPSGTGEMDSYDDFAKRFCNKYGFLPFGKDDPSNPTKTKILIELSKSFAEIESLQAELTRLREAVEVLVREWNDLNLRPDLYTPTERNIWIGCAKQLKQALSGKGGK